MKRFLTFLCTVILLCTLAGCSMHGRTNNVIRFLQEDPEGLQSFATTTLETGEVDENIHFNGVEGYDFVAPDWIAFLTGSRTEKGITYQVGFYYSPQDTPLGYRGEEMELTAFDDGYQYLYENGMEYYTERVQENWYFFEYNKSDGREEDPFLDPEL